MLYKIVKYIVDISLKGIYIVNKINLIEKNQEKKNIISRGNKYKSWTKYYVIFSGGYLYFFQNNKDLVPIQYTYIKNSDVQILLDNTG